MKAQKMKSLYFIAIVPPPELSETIRGIQKDFVDNYQSVKAYNNFPHITIIPPFYAEVEAKLTDQFKNINTLVTPFEITLNNYGFFDKKRGPVVYLKPMLQPALNQLKNDFSILSPVALHEYYTSHLTVAFRDLSYEQFLKAKEIYRHKKFQAVFPVYEVGLYKHINRKWKLIAELALKNPY